jgi:hypothetical protein
VTKDQRLAEATRRAKEKLAKDRKALAYRQEQEREAGRKARDRRRYQVGALADAAGLLAWEDAALRELFAALYQNVSGTPSKAVNRGDDNGVPHVRQQVGEDEHPLARPVPFVSERSM